MCVRERKETNIGIHIIVYNRMDHKRIYISNSYQVTNEKERITKRTFEQLFGICVFFYSVENQKKREIWIPNKSIHVHTYYSYSSTKGSHSCIIQK